MTMIRCSVDCVACGITPWKTVVDAVVRVRQTGSRPVFVHTCMYEQICNILCKGLNELRSADIIYKIVFAFTNDDGRIYLVTVFYTIRTTPWRMELDKCGLARQLCIAEGKEGRHDGKKEEGKK